MNKNTGGPAFPRPIGEYKVQGAGKYNDAQKGMTLRDYFAAAAMQGALAGEPGGHLIPDRLAANSYRYADAMLAARECEQAALPQAEQQAEGQDVDRIERIPGSPLYVRFISNKYDIEEALLCVEDDDADMRDLGTLYSWECANLFLEAAKQSLLTDPHRTLREAEEYQCLEQVFDDRGVPTHEDGKKLSHVGRFIAATQPAEQPEAGRGVCSRCHGVDSDCDALMSDDPTACPCRCHEPQVQEAGWDEAVAVVHDDDSGGHWVELTDDVKDGDLLYLHPPANAEAVRLINLAEDFALAVSSITDETFVLGDDHCVDAHELADEFGEFLAQHGGRGDE